METYIKPPRTGMEAFELMPEGTLCQLINNVLVMSPAPNPLHLSVSGIIYEQISGFVRSHESGKVFFSPIDVYLDNNNVFQPDIVYISNSKLSIIDWKKGIIGAPDLVVEILSKGNKSYDIIKKKSIYAKSGVKEYWVVDPETKWCEGFISGDGIYTSLGEENAQLIIHTLGLSISF